MLGALDRLESKADLAASVTYVAVDTDGSNLQNTLPDDAHHVEIAVPTDPEQLPDDLGTEASPPEDGTGRDRRLGRYALDNAPTFDDVDRELRQVVGEAHYQSSLDNLSQRSNKTTMSCDITIESPRGKL
jgi:hypothetical protein